MDRPPFAPLGSVPNEGDRDMRQVAFLAAMLAAAPAVSAEPLSLSSKNRAGLFESQTDLLDRRAARQYSDSVRLQPEPAAIPPRLGTLTYDGRYNGPWLDVARSAARRHSVPVGLFLRLVQRESAWNPAARSHKGAIGLAQLMPGTARLLAVDATDPRQNLDGGARYLRQQYERFRDWRLALAAYNAGPEAVARYGGIPPYAETRAYVTAILSR